MLLGGVLLASPDSWSLVEVARVTTKTFFGRFSDFKWLKINLDAILELQKVENEEKVCYVAMGDHTNTLRGL